VLSYKKAPLWLQPRKLLPVTEDEGFRLLGSSRYPDFGEQTPETQTDSRLNLPYTLQPNLYTPNPKPETPNKLNS
jgi:hypothetical protein